MTEENQLSGNNGGNGWTKEARAVMGSRPATQPVGAGRIVSGGRPGAVGQFQSTFASQQGAIQMRGPVGHRTLNPGGNMRVATAPFAAGGFLGRNSAPVAAQAPAPAQVAAPPRTPMRRHPARPWRPRTMGQNGTAPNGGPPTPPGSKARAWGKMKKLEAEALGLKLDDVIARLGENKLPTGVISQIRDRLMGFAETANATAEIEITEEEGAAISEAILSLNVAESSSGTTAGTLAAFAVIAGIGWYALS